MALNTSNHNGSTEKMLHKSLLDSLIQFEDILTKTNALPADKAHAFYCKSNAGKHVRHVLDHILAFIPCVESGVLDYNLRNRESAVETDWHAAQEQLSTILEKLESLNFDNKNIEVISEIGVCTTTNTSFRSNIAREVLYLINHTIHHAAYIRLLGQGCGVTLGDHIGIAPATATYIRKAG